MRNIFLVLVIFNLSLKAQDTIRFRNGEVKAVKVSEVGVSDVHYTRFDNVDGPKYIVGKNDIQLIKYSGGQIDSFAVEKPVVKVVEKPKEYNMVQGYGLCEKIIIKHGKLFCNGKAVGESRLSKIMQVIPDNEKKNKMMRAYAEMKSHKKKQYLFGFIGLGVGLAAPYFGMVASVISGELTPVLVGVLVGTGVGITGAVISSINKSKRTAKKMEIARIYNGD